VRATGRTEQKSKPGELLPLGSLRYLGQDWTFDDLKENTGIGEQTFGHFFHKFVNFGSTASHAEFVITPTKSNQEAASHQHDFAHAGCQGATGSADAAHVTLEKVQKTV
jgi:hypothetical protein